MPAVNEGRSVIPELPVQPALSTIYQDFLDVLKQRQFCGTIAADYATRLVHATDNSVYQVLPEAVVFPSDEADVQCLFKLAAESQFNAIQFAPRGGGTGTNGQSLNTGIVIDLSRFQKNILDIDTVNARARVQAGVVLDQLQDQINPLGYFFAPELSPSNRATLGGMANTDACGKGSRIYGRTGDHVLSVRAVLCSGEVIVTERLNLQQLKVKQAGNSHEAVIYREAGVACENVPAHPGSERLGRFVTAYNLWQAFSKEQDSFSLNPLLCGSEGTLAVITELTLKLTPIPKCRALFAIRYDSFDAALSEARALLQYSPSAIETVDDKILNLAKNDVIFPRVRPYLGTQEDFAGNAINLVEFVADDAMAFAEKTAQLQRHLETLDSVISFHLTEDREAQTALWELRKKGVGLLGNSKGKRRPIPFVEDTAVPPECLADYIRDFRALLDRHQLSYGMFGHVDVGCLHVRPALDLRNADDMQLFKNISDEVCALVARYGGVMWSEHGKGFRSAYGPEFHGPDIYPRMRRVKTAFDPHNQLNPGKICGPLHSENKLFDTFAHTRAERDRSIAINVEEHAQGAIYCNGNGQCFDYRMDNVMCPSYKATGNRLHSPKGRSGLMREWLKALGEHKHDMDWRHYEALTASEKWARESLRLKPAGSNKNRDFSHEVNEAMSGCLSCKACSTACPIKVDVPAQKSLFLFHYHRRYPRPLRDYLMGSLEQWGQFAARMPALSNLLMGNFLSRWLAKKCLGVSSLPSFSDNALERQLWRYPERRFERAKFDADDDATRARTVLLVQDPFSSFFDADLVINACELLELLGFRAQVLPFIATGKALHVKGRLPQFAQQAADAQRALMAQVPSGIPVIGLEPAVVLLWRQEFAQLNMANAEKPTVPPVLLLQEFLVQHLDKLPAMALAAPVFLFLHCTEKTQVLSAGSQWQKIFGQCGVRLATPSTGCCGMAGSFGHETEHQKESAALFEQSWRDALKEAGQQGTACATGYSCRSQVQRMSKQSLPHPVQVLLELMKSGT